MMKKTHVAAGLATAYALNMDPVLVVAGAILPDADCVLLHRKLLHNVFVLLLAFAYNTALGAGLLTHLLLDMLTVSGVAVAWPFSNSRFRMARFKTGGLFDILLFILFVVSWVVLDAAKFV